MKSAVRFGLYNAAAGIFWVLLMYVTGLNRSDYGNYINILGIALPLVFISMAIKDYRLHQGHGYISFAAAFRQSFTVAIIGGVIGTLFMLLYMNVIDPSYTEFQYHLREVKMADMGMSQEEIDKALERGRSFETPGWFLLFGLIGSLLMAMIFSAIMAAILKKPNPEEIS
jgi:hypothetical protein